MITGTLQTIMAPSYFQPLQIGLDLQILIGLGGNFLQLEYLMIPHSAIVTAVIAAYGTGALRRIHICIIIPAFKLVKMNLLLQD
jgi:hypothetical protein